MPGHPEKVAILEERARLGCDLWHRFDAKAREDTTMPLTADDVKHGDHWLVIGTRPDGDRCVLWTGLQRAKALAKAEDFRRQLEDYASIDVECDDPKVKEIPVGENNGSKIEAIKAAHERVKAAKAVETAGTKPWAEMNRNQRSEAIRELVRELGPDKNAPEVVAEGKRRGMDFVDHMVKYARRLCGFVGQGSGARCGPSRRPDNQPPIPKPRPVAAARPPATPAEPQPAGPLDDVLEGVQLLGLALVKLGGKANTLRTLETLSTWSERD